jgi:hypothetical protein
MLPPTAAVLRISLVALLTWCCARNDLGPRGAAQSWPVARYAMLPAGLSTPSAITNKFRFRGSISSGSASPVTFIPRTLSHLRINRPVTWQAARLDTEPRGSRVTRGRFPLPCRYYGPRPLLIITVLSRNAALPGASFFMLSFYSSAQSGILGASTVYFTGQCRLLYTPNSNLC